MNCENAHPRWRDLLEVADDHNARDWPEIYTLQQHPVLKDAFARIDAAAHQACHNILTAVGRGTPQFMAEYERKYPNAAWIFRVDMARNGR